MENKPSGQVKTLIWDQKSLQLIDQRKLPFEEIYLNCTTPEEVSAAIKDMVVRGAPAIGVTAAYGLALAALEFKGRDFKQFLDYINEKAALIASARPTAVNLSWALERMKETAKRNLAKGYRDVASLRKILVREAENIEKEDVALNFHLGENGASIFLKTKKKLKILTYCNAGALATAGYGTAFGVIRSLHSRNKVEKVVVSETRPYLQGARLTAWECYQEKIPFFIITDNMSGHFMSRSMVDIVVVGADRISANGDTANKIGTLSNSILAKYFKIPFYVAAPVSTIDTKTSNGSKIPIEERNGKEVREVFGKVIIPDYMDVANPAFDVTPHENISAIITEKGVIYPPFRENIKKMMNR